MHSSRQRPGSLYLANLGSEAHRELSKLEGAHNALYRGEMCQRRAGGTKIARLQ